MLLWEDIARAQKAAQDRDKPSIVACPKCEGTYFTLEEYKQYRTDMPVGISQKPVNAPQTKTFYFYRCLCGELLEPNITTNMSTLSDEYIKVIDNIKKILDAKNKE